MTDSAWWGFKHSRNGDGCYLVGLIQLPRLGEPVAVGQRRDRAERGVLDLAGQHRLGTVRRRGGNGRDLRGRITRIGDNPATGIGDDLDLVRAILGVSQGVCVTV